MMQTIQRAPDQDVVNKRLVDDALTTSRYRLWYYASIATFICSLLIPNPIGFLMLIFGWVDLKTSHAWLANPLLIAALIMVRPHGALREWRWLAYCSLVFMLTTPMKAIANLAPFPFLLWLASAVFLIIGTERYRSIHRKLSIRTSSSD